jgi:hypothetical protein
MHRLLSLGDVGRRFLQSLLSNPQRASATEDPNGPAFRLTGLSKVSDRRLHFTARGFLRNLFIQTVCGHPMGPFSGATAEPSSVSTV